MDSSTEKPIAAHQIGAENSKRSKKRGRPQANIFAYSSIGQAQSAEQVKAKVDFRHHMWRSNERAKRRERLMQSNSAASNLPDSRLRTVKDDELYPEGHEDRSIHYAAERAMAILRKVPEKIEGRPFHLRDVKPLDREAIHFYHSLCKSLGESSRKGRGRKLNAETVFKTALSYFVARKLRMPKGGNAKTLPTAREIAQVWYVIFGEVESHESIKARMNTVADITFGCATGEEFAKAARVWRKRRPRPK